MIISEADLHSHLKERMEQRGVTLDEINQVLQNGFKARDAKEGTEGKVFVFEYNNVWGVTYRIDSGESLELNPGIPAVKVKDS